MKTVEEIKSKLQKLFAMMEANSGASQQEVETAMVKARKLMSEYKLSEEDITGKITTEVIQQPLYDIVFSTQKNPWISKLAAVIGNNYCCHAVMFHTYGAKTHSPGFIGFAEDIEIATKVLKYAVDCALAENAKIRRQATRKGYTNADATAMGNAFGNGYVQGIQEAFAKQNQEEQQESNSFAMVMVEPQAVKDYVHDKCQKKNFDVSKANSKARSYDRYAAAGYLAGKEFDMKSRLAG